MRVMLRWACLAILGIAFACRFPVHFAFEPPYLMDFEVYRLVAERVVQGLGHQLYEPTTSSVMLFKYGPCWAVLLAPLAWLPAFPGALAWSTLTVGWLVAGCAGVLHLCRSAGLRAPFWLPAAAVLLLLRPISAEFLNGQIDLLWGLLVIGFLVAETARRPWWSAICLALAMSLKLPAVVFLGYLVVRGRWKSALGALGMFAAVNLVSAAVITPRDPLGLLAAWADVLRSSGADRAFEIGNQNLLSLLGRLLMNDGYHLNLADWPAQAVWVAAAAAVAALFALVVAGRPNLILDGALLTILMVLGSPTVWIATYSALLLPVMLGVACALTAPPRRWRDAPDAALLALVLLGSLMTHSGFWKAINVRSFRTESYVYLVFMVLPWFGLALFGYLWRQRRRLDAGARGT